MWRIAQMPELTQMHFDLMKLYLQIMGGVVLGSNLFKTIQNIVPAKNGNENNEVKRNEK